MGIGIAPTTEFLRSSPGLDTLLDKTGAVAVDECLRMTGIPGGHVYVIGAWRVTSRLIFADRRVPPPAVLEM